jgi:cell wall-associated NlpC family hydrolase
LRRPLLTALFALSLVAVSACIAEARTHRVLPGETLGSIAATEHVSVSEIARLNDLEGDNPDLAPGSILVLDAVTTAPAPDPAVAARAVAAVRAAERASAPTEGADVAMWEPKSDDDSSPLHKLASRIIDRASSIASNLARDAMHFLGVPYSFGGTSAAGFDCSGYVQHVFAMLGIRLPRTADAQFAQGERVRGGDLQVGDLVFFQTYAPGASHVGIYLGNDEFVHASSSHGVMVSKLSESYWATRYIGAKRIVASR